MAFGELGIIQDRAKLARTGQLPALDAARLQEIIRNNQRIQQATTKQTLGEKLLPAAGAVLGGAALAPLTGGSSLAAALALAGGVGAGGAAGEAVRQKTTGEADDGFDIGNILQEGAISGGLQLGTAGLGTAFKAAKAGSAAKAVKSTKDTGKIAKAASTADLRLSGLQPGQSVGSGRTLNIKQSRELLKFARDNGVRPGTVAQQADDATRLLDDVSSRLSSELDEVNRLLTGSEKAKITKAIQEKVKRSKAVTGNTKTMDKFLDDLDSVDDLKKLEDLRFEADDIGFTQSGAGKTSAAAQARSVRESIDEFITPLSKSYKTTKGQYQNARDLVKLTSKASGSSRASTQLPVLGMKVPQTGIASKVASRVSGGGSSRLAGALSGAQIPQPISQLGTQTAGRVVPELLQGGGAPTEAEAISAIDAEIEQDLQEGSQSPAAGLFGLDPQTAAQNILLQGGSIDDAIEVATQIQELQGLFGTEEEEEVQLTSEQEKAKNNAESALRDIAILRSELSEGGPKQLGSALSAGPLAGLINRAFGTTEFEAAKENVVDAIARLRSGAAITEDEAARYMRLLPGSFDSPADIEAKLTRLEQLLTSAATPRGSTINEVVPAGEL